MNGQVDNFNLAGAWRRFFARNVDLYIGILVIGMLAQLTLANTSTWYVNLMNTPNNDYVVGILFIPFALLLDALICHFFGNNLGKYILGVHVRKIKGDVSLKDWIRRNLGVWVSGYALGFPLVNLWTMYNQKTRVDERKQASYDEKLGFQVFADELNTFKKVRAFVVIGLVYLVVIALQVMVKEKDSELAKVQSAPSYTWQNPVTKIDVLVSPQWKFDATKNGDGQNIYTFSEITGHAAIVFAMESGQIPMSQYVTALQKATAQNMLFTGGGKYLESNGMNTWIGTGSMANLPGSLLVVEVRQTGNQFWRVVTIQDKPYDYSENAVQGLKQILWSTIQ